MESPNPRRVPAAAPRSGGGEGAFGCVGWFGGLYFRAVDALTLSAARFAREQERDGYRAVGTMSTTRVDLKVVLLGQKNVGTLSRRAARLARRGTD